MEGGMMGATYLLMFMARGAGNFSLIKARSYLLRYRFIIQYDMIYVA